MKDYVFKYAILFSVLSREKWLNDGSQVLLLIFIYTNMALCRQSDILLAQKIVSFDPIFLFYFIFIFLCQYNLIMHKS